MELPRLAVFNTQPPHLYFGGVERRILETAKRLKNNVEMTVYSGTKAGFTKAVDVDGARIVPCHSTDTVFPLDNWVFNRTLAGMAGEITADVYEAHAASGNGFLKALKKRKANVPFIQTVHGVLADEYLQAKQTGGLSFRERTANLFMWQLSRVESNAARNADLVVTVSNYSKRRIVELYHVDEGRIRVVPNGVDPEKFKPAAVSDDLKEKYSLGGRQVVLFVGNLIPRKGVGYLVEAAKTVLKEKPDSVFVIVGKGPLKNQLTATLQRLNLSSNFLFLSDVTDEQLPTLYNCADVFAMPSIQEGQGIALLEAEASAKPVVAFDVSGVKEAVADRKSGLLIERGNSERLSEAIVKLLADQMLREQMGAAGREFVLQNFTWDMCAQKMLEIYREALGT
jgi:glycosyltransferase involved in cell wall biosynthesis